MTSRIFLNVLVVIASVAASAPAAAFDPYEFVEGLKPLVEQARQIEEREQQEKARRNQAQQEREQEQYERDLQQYNAQKTLRARLQEEERIRQEAEEEAAQEAMAQRERADREAAEASKRRELEASVSHCISAHFRGYGGFDNRCPFPVAYGYCVQNPKPGSWTDSAGFNCRYKTSETNGGQTVGANSSDANHTTGGTRVHWYACREGAYVKMRWTGSDLSGRCVPW